MKRLCLREVRGLQQGAAQLLPPRGQEGETVSCV